MDVYEREFGYLSHFEPKVTVYEQFILQNLNRMLRLYNFLPRDMVMLRFEELWQRHLLRHPDIRKTHEEERKNAKKSRRPNRQRTPGRNVFRARVSDDVNLYTSPAPKSKASRKRQPAKHDKRSSPKPSRARCYPPLKIKTLKRTLPVSEENHAAPSTVPPPRERRRPSLPSTRSSAHTANNDLGAAVSVQTNSNAKLREDDNKSFNGLAAVEQNTALRKSAENEETSPSSPRNDPNEGIQRSSTPETRCSPRTPSTSATAEREDAATEEEAIEMGRMGTPSSCNKHEREIRTTLFSEPMSLCSSVGHEEIYVRDWTPTEMLAATEDDALEPVNQLKSPVAAREKGRTAMLLSEPMSLCDSIVLGESDAQSFISTEDAFDRRVDRSASKKGKPFHRKLSLPRRSKPLQSNVTVEDSMHAGPGSEKMELGADEELKICPVREIQRGEKQILHEPLQRFGDAANKTATQNRRITETCAEEQPVRPEEDRHLLGTVQHSRFVHNKLEMRPAAAKHSDGEHQISLPKGTSGLADIVRSARPRKFEHCKVLQGSEPSGTEDTVDATASREQHDVSSVVGKLSTVKQTVRQSVHSSKRIEGRETTVILPDPEGRGATEVRSEKPDLGCAKDLSTSNLCHAEAESNGSSRPERTSKSAHVEDCKASRAGVTDGPSLPEGRDGAASPESTHNMNAKSIATVQAGDKKTKMPTRKELPPEDSQADPLPGTEHPAPPQRWKVKWKDTTKRKTKCAPGAGVADVHDNRESSWDESGRDDELFPFVARQKCKDKQKRGKKATDEERRDKKKPDREQPGREHLPKDETMHANLVGGVCNEKEMVQPPAKNGKQKRDKNPIKKVPDEGESWKKKPGEVRSDGKGIEETRCAERQMTEKSKRISAKQKRADKQTEKRSKKTASLQRFFVGKKLAGEAPGKTKHGKKQQDEGRSTDERPDKTQQAGRKPSRGGLQQIKSHREKNGRKRLFQAVPEESLAHEGRDRKKHQSDGKSEGMHKEKVPLEKQASKADQGKENRKQVTAEISNEKQDKLRSGKERHNEKEHKITTPIKKGRDRKRKEADPFLPPFEKDLNRDLTTCFSDVLEELSNEIEDNDFLSDKCPDENILGEEKCTFGGGDEKMVTDEARFVPFSLESDEDGDQPKECVDEASYFLSSSRQKKQKVSLSFAQDSSDSEELFLWPVGDELKPKPKRSVRFTDPGFQVASPTNNDSESFDTCESNSRATTPPCNPWKDIVTRSATSPDRTDTYGDEIVQELRRNFEKHQAILVANCVLDVNEPSQGWSGSDDCPVLLSRDRPDLFSSSPEDIPQFDV